MRFCTLSRTIVCCVLAGALGCGDDVGDDGNRGAARTTPLETTPLREPGESGTETRTACGLLDPPGLAAKANDSLDLSVCDWRGRGRHIQLVLDTAPRAQLRFYNQFTEQLELHNTDRGGRPHQVKRVGDDSAYGGAGAYWTPTRSQLVAYAEGRIVRIRVAGGGQREAVDLARQAFRRLSAAAG